MASKGFMSNATKSIFTFTEVSKQTMKLMTFSFLLMIMINISMLEHGGLDSKILITLN